MPVQTTFNVQPLIRARLKKRMSRAEIAAGIGVTEQTIRNVESGASRSEKTIMAYSEFVEVPMSKVIVEEKVS